MSVELEWYGVSTFRLRVGDLVVFLDAYLDRVSGAPPTGLSTLDVDRADAILVGHSHFDHLHGAQAISDRTGALIVGSHETVRLMAKAGVPRTRLLAVTGGDLVDLGAGVRARVLPSLHSCTWTTTTPGEDEHAVPLQERQRRLAEGSHRTMGSVPAIVDHIRAAGERPRGDGGALGYLIDTPAGRVYWTDTSGYWTGIVRDLRPELAILAAAGRGNVDGEPSSTGLPEFLAEEVALMRPGQVVLCHHDDWMPPVTAPGDVAAIRAAVSQRSPDVPVHALPYGQIFEL